MPSRLFYEDYSPSLPLDPADGRREELPATPPADIANKSLALSQEMFLDQACNRFEAAWTAGTRPRIEEYLGGAAEPVRSALLQELILVDIYFRRRAGEDLQPADYAGRFPTLGRAWIDQALQTSKAPASASTALPDIPGYEVLGLIGYGGMGVVYKARQTQLKRLTAIKMILSGPQARPEELARFRREAEVVARLHHPNIVQIYEVGEHDGRPYFAQEYVDGGSLAEQLHGAPQPPREAARLLVTLAQAVHHAHEHHVIHRDLKPANILLQKSEIQNPKSEKDCPAEVPGLEFRVSNFGFRISDFTPKVTDFGLAKQLDADLGPTQSGALLGTPSYMAPEQAAGAARTAGPATDVYALGAILYELLTGRPPFQGTTVPDTLEQVRYHEPVSPSRLQPKVPRDLVTVCLKCLAKEPGKRYASARHLAEDLQRFLNNEPIQARPVSRAEKLWRWTRRNPILAGVSGVAGAALVGVTLVSILFAVTKSQYAHRLEAEQARTLGALTEVQNQSARATQSLRKANQESAHLALAKGQALFGQGEGGRGLLWLARALDYATRAEDEDLQRAVRANLDYYHPENHVLKAIFRHEHGVEAVAFGRDGKTLVSGSRDKTARLWDVATGQVLGPPLPHPKYVQAVALSPDGTRILTGCDDHQARLWDAATGQLVFPPLPHRDEVLAVAFSPDGTLLVTASADQTAQRWDARTGQPFGTPLQHSSRVNAVAFSPDGQTFGTGSATGEVYLWRAPTGTRLGSSLQHPSRVEALAFRPDGQALLVGGGSGAQLWDLAGGRPIGPPLPQQASAHSAAFSPDGQTVLIGYNDGKVRLWDLTTRQPLGPSLEHRGRAKAVAFHPDGKTFLTGSDDGAVRLWAVAPGPLPRRSQTIRDNARVTAISPDGRSILLTDYVGGRLWQPDAHPARQVALPHDKTLAQQGAFSPDGKWLVTAGYDNKVRVWHAATGELAGPPLSFPDTVRALAFRPDGRQFLTAGDDGLQLWDVQRREPVPSPIRYRDNVYAAAYRPDGGAILTGGWNYGLRLWDVASGNLLCQFRGHQAVVVAVAFSADGSRVLSGSYDKTARLWDAATGHPLAVPLEHDGWILSVALSPDGSMVLTGGRDNTARLWDAGTGKPIGEPIRQEAVNQVFFHPDGRTFLTCSLNGPVILRPVPVPVAGASERIRLWAEASTNLAMDDFGAVRILDAATLEQQRRRLQELGGAPVP